MIDTTKKQAKLEAAKVRLDKAAKGVQALEAKLAAEEAALEALREAIATALVALARQHFPSASAKKIKALTSDRDLKEAASDAAEAIFNTVASSPSSSDRVYYALNDAKGAVEIAREDLVSVFEDAYQVSAGCFESHAHMFGKVEPSKAFEDFEQGETPHPKPNTPFHAAYPIYVAMAEKYGRRPWCYHDVAKYLTGEHLNYMHYVPWLGTEESMLGDRFPEMMADFRAAYTPLLEQYLGPAQPREGAA